MYTLVLMSVLASNSNAPGCGHHQHAFRGWGGNIHTWNGFGCDWFPSGGWYGGPARGPHAWAAYGAHVNGGNTYNGTSAFPVADYPYWNGYAGFSPGGAGGHATPIMMCALTGCPTGSAPLAYPPPPGPVVVSPVTTAPPAPLPEPQKKATDGK